MEKQIFREKSVNRISSPEELNDYLRVTNPTIWAILAAVIILLGGFLVWCSVGVLETKVKAEIVVEDRIAVCAVSGNKASQVKEGMILELEGNEYEVETVKIDTYGQAVASAEVSVADGTYDGTNVIERVTPISFLFH